MARNKVSTATAMRPSNLSSKLRRIWWELAEARDRTSDGATVSEMTALMQQTEVLIGWINRKQGTVA